MKYLFTILITLASISATQAQTDTARLKIEADSAVVNGDYRKAFEQYFEILKEDSTRDDILTMSAACLFAEGEYKTALSFMTRAITVNDNKYMHYHNRAVMFVQLSMYDLAIADYKSSLERMVIGDSSNVISAAEINIALGYCYLYQRKFDSTLYFADATLAIDSVYKEGIHLKVNTLIEMKAMDEVPKLIARILRTEPNKIETKYLQVWYYVNADKYNEAVGVGEEILKTEDNPHGIFFNNLAFAYYKLGKYKTAMKTVNEAIAQVESNSYAYKNRALIHIANGDINDACEDLHMAQTLDFKTTYGDEVEQLILEHCNKM